MVPTSRERNKSEPLSRRRPSATKHRVSEASRGPRLRPASGRRKVEEVRKEWAWHDDGQLATMVLPEFVPARPWHALLHNQTAWLIEAALLYRRRQLGFQRTVIHVILHPGR